MWLSLPKFWRPKTRAAVRDGARTGPLCRRRPRAACNPLRKIGFEAGEFRPRFLRLAGTGALAVRRCLYEIVYDMRRVVPCSCFAGDACGFFHHSAEYLPPILSSQLRVNCTSLYARPRQHYVLFTCCDQREAEGLARSRPPRSRRKSPDLPSAWHPRLTREGVALSSLPNSRAISGANSDVRW